MSDRCGICNAPMGNDDYYSAYTPYPTHADKSICVANIRADERAKIKEELSDASETVYRIRMQAVADARADEREQNAKALIEEANKYRHGTETDYRHGIQYAASFLRRKR